MNRGFGINDSDTVLPKAVRQSWTTQLGDAEIVPVAPGMSGARLYRCISSSGDCLALKRWPSETDPSRVAEVHRVMIGARANGCNLIPEVIKPHKYDEVGSYVTHDGYCWDLIQWMPGRPLSVDAGLAEIQSGAAAIGQFHRSAVVLGQRSQVAPVVKERLSRLAQLSNRIDSLIEAATRCDFDSELTVAVHRAGQLLQLKWNEVFPQMVQSLSACAQQPLMTQFVMRDVHREHILFSSGNPAGLIDFDALRVDSPAVDLARWAGSFRVFWKDPAQAWQAILAGVSSNRPSIKGDLTEHELTLAAAIAGANPWISLANWLDWLFIDGRSFPGGHPAIAQRIGELSDSAAQGV